MTRLRLFPIYDDGHFRTENTTPNKQRTRLNIQTKPQKTATENKQMEQKKGTKKRSLTGTKNILGRVRFEEWSMTREGVQCELPSTFL